jgi:hypothetical protein
MKYIVIGSILTAGVLVAWVFGTLAALSWFLKQLRKGEDDG